MIPSHMPDAPRVKLLYMGNVGKRCGSLLLQSSIDVTAMELGSAPITASDYEVVALATDRPYPHVERALDQDCWAAGVPWTSAVLLAHEFRVGPTTIPGRTPCYDCWERRARSMVPDLDAEYAIDELASKGPLSTWFAGELNVLTEQVAALLTAEVLSLTTKCYPLPPHRLGRYWEGDAVFGYLQARVFARVGLCARCAQGEQTDATWRQLAKYFEGRK